MWIFIRTLVEFDLERPNSHDSTSRKEIIMFKGRCIESKSL